KFWKTNQRSPPAPGTCGGNLGIARNYAVNYKDASAMIDNNASGGLTSDDRSKVHPGGGYPPSPVPVVVDLNGKQYQGVISGTDVPAPPGGTLGARLRTFWYKKRNREAAS